MCLWNCEARKRNLCCFAVASQTAKVIATECDDYLMKMEKALKETIDKAKKERESNEGEKIFANDMIDKR